MLLLILFTSFVHAASKAPPVAPSPIPTPKPLVYVYNYGQSVNKALADDAVEKLNRVYLSGCLERRFSQWPIKTTENVFGIKYKNQTEAFKVFEAKRPYKIDLRWYTTERTDSIGYTYNFHLEKGAPFSEERIWSNQAKIKTSTFYASHIAHELSHQARTGGFGHYSYHQGTFPYEIGDVVWDCLTK